MDIGEFQNVQEQLAGGVGAALHFPFRPQPVIYPVASLQRR
jgi:hypothetical protein